MLQPYPWGQIKIRGYVGERIDAVIDNRIMRQDIAALVDPFIKREDDRQWRGEFWGKWFLSLVDAWNYTQNPHVRQKLEEALDALLKTQDERGLITANRQRPGRWGIWDIWGRRYTLSALLSWHQSSHDERALRAARRLADYTMDELNRHKTSVVQTGLFQGLPSSTIIAPLVDLYRHTREDRYLEFAQSIVVDWNQFDGPRLIDKALEHVPVADRISTLLNGDNWFSRENGLKAYEMMACYEALGHLYRQTGEPRYLAAIRNAWQSIRDDEIMITGSGTSRECWCHGRRRQLEDLPTVMESCTAMLWIKLSWLVLQLTCNAAVADEIERTFYNAYLHSMKPDGSWFTRHNPLSGVQVPGDNQCGMDQNCCVANGPRIMMLWPQMCIVRGERGPIINFYGQCQANITLADGGGLEISMESDYPRSGDVLIKVAPARPRQFILNLRIPAWCDRAQVCVNGKPCQNVLPGTYLAIDRLWSEEDRIEASFGMNARVIEARDQAGMPHQAACFGPLLLARDKRIDLLGLDQPVQIKTTGEGKIQAVAYSPAAHPDSIMITLKIPVIAGGVETSNPYCDYASAGNTWTPASAFRVWDHNRRPDRSVE